MKVEVVLLCHIETRCDSTRGLVLSSDLREPGSGRFLYDTFRLPYMGTGQYQAHMSLGPMLERIWHKAIY